MPKAFSGTETSRILRLLTSAKLGVGGLSTALLVAYGILPFFLWLTSDADDIYLELSMVSLVSVASIWLGSKTSVFDLRFMGVLPRVRISPTNLNINLWLVFGIFVFTAWGTAEQIPIVAALSGADSGTIAVLREEFLKARTGWQASFVYINAILTGALIPYSIALLFLHEMRTRWFALTFFLLFCISFVEKAFFFKGIFPLFYLFTHGKVKTNLSPRTLIVITALTLFLVTRLSGAGNGQIPVGDLDDGGEFFAVSYVPKGEMQHLIWRSVAIPLVTAADSLRVHQEEFGGRLLLGSTSSFVAGIFGIERVEFERLVFAAQWGQNETATGSSNSVFFIEAFINFGWFGVVVFSYVVGLCMRLFVLTPDDAIRAVWPIFAFAVYVSGLIGIMLSNGFLSLFLIASYVDLGGSNRKTRQARRPNPPRPFRG